MNRMQDYLRKSVAKGNYGIADFVCPTNELREQFYPEYVIWMNTIEEGRFEDTIRCSKYLVIMLMLM